jgi:hypothetical protein
MPSNLISNSSGTKISKTREKVSLCFARLGIPKLHTFEHNDMIEVRQVMQPVGDQHSCATSEQAIIA